MRRTVPAGGEDLRPLPENLQKGVPSFAPPVNWTWAYRWAPSEMQTIPWGQGSSYGSDRPSFIFGKRKP